MMRHHLLLVRMAIIKIKENQSFWPGALVLCSWGCKLQQLLWKTAQQFLRKLTQN